MNEHETIADIIAAMRDEGRTGESSCLEWVGAKMRHYADRLEAAHKREVCVAEALGVAKVGLAKMDAVGDSAKLREAAQKTNATLEEALEILNGISDEEAGKLNARIEDVADAICEVTQEIIPDALAAPPRNCDRFATVDEARKAHEAICEKYGKCHHGCPLNNDEHYSAFDCFEAWLFATATEKEGGGDNG